MSQHLGYFFKKDNTLSSLVIPLTRLITLNVKLLIICSKLQILTLLLVPINRCTIKLVIQ